MYSTLAGEQYHELLVPKSAGPTTRATLAGECTPAPECSPSQLSPRVQPEPDAIAVSSQVPSHTPVSTALPCVASPALATSCLTFLLMPSHCACVSGSAIALGINPDTRGGPHGPAWVPCHLLPSPLPFAPPGAPCAPGPQMCFFQPLTHLFSPATCCSVRRCHHPRPLVMPTSFSALSVLITSQGACVAPGRGQIICPAPQLPPPRTPQVASTHRWCGVSGRCPPPTKALGKAGRVGLPSAPHGV